MDEVISIFSVFQKLFSKHSYPSSNLDIEQPINNAIEPVPQLDNTAGDFDENSGGSWIFPIGFEKRDYQLNISQSCLFTNTLVCLPTGLGKTFIAAVVIYNFYRWFPRSKIIFMASFFLNKIRFQL